MLNTKQLYDLQTEIENKYSRKNIRKYVKNDINPEHIVFIKLLQLIQDYRDNLDYYKTKQDRVDGLTLPTEDIALELLSVILPIQEVSPIQALATQLGLNLGYTNLLDGVKTASELIAIGEASTAYTIFHSQDINNHTGTLSIKSNFQLDGVTQDLINTTKYLPPMVCVPVNWADNLTGGQLQGSGSCILGAQNHHNGEQSLDVLNTLQHIAWQINEMVDYVETPNKELAAHDQKVQFQIMQEQSLKVYQELMDHGNKFYFVWKNDSRGRMYTQGYHCHLQSTQYKKAILDFYKEELIQ